ncbi:Ankyrin repeat and BTB/POZ domain-containing protein 1 [Pleodorina starrii]|uniref:Ankyrin repeat and BTB/POZ domain-containing protein 1 n=1 Tax=Pleodorina starrii TaxID=330485 RepID=A0A9W6BE52_9CHLO|nr:Ankyrin repeat and BTB/POZ domain-containing protein 1 [Pleodorina starrii]
MRCMAAGRGGAALYIADGQSLRILDKDGRMATIQTAVKLPGSPACMAVLPSGCLVVCGQTRLCLVSGDGGGGGLRYSPSSESLAGRARGEALADMHRLLLLADSGDATDDDNSSGSGRGQHTVTVRAGGARFLVHRAALVARSEYFQRLLAPDGGSADSGAACGEISLPDAHPEALGLLLTFLYTGQLHVPEELLRPAAELAGRLLLPAACVEQLAARLLAGVTPGSVVSDLVWAERHGLAELAEQLKSYLLRNRTRVALGGLDELAERCPRLAAEIIRGLVRIG